MKRALIILIALAVFLPASVPARSAPAPAPPAQADKEKPVLSAIAPWPAKAAWVGQQATIVPAKLYASSSYLLIFRDPDQDMSGVDQLFLARKNIGQIFTVQGLYKLAKKGAAARYFWRLDSKDGTVLWIRDYPEVTLSGLPFALDSEIEAEKRAIAEINSLVGNTIWIDRNYIPPKELTADVAHLAPLTVTAFKSAGPFSEAYALSLRREDGSPVVWTIAPTGVRAAFSNSQFYGMIRSGFMRHNPQTLFPHWPQDDWQLIRDQEIRAGWDKDKVLMSWGEPKMPPVLVPDGSEEDMYEWRYGNYYLYFKNNVLLKIKIPDPAYVPAKADDKSASGGKPAARQGNKQDKKDGPKMIEIPAAKKNDNRESPQNKRSG
ncbi:hypothetical protein [Anaeroselena agilis]|uniref:Uncharacterized protein n=1 Tax=Anaeroselena agilis TaxID=3063788 RepID=A0ABU3P238_9FIRM|nr:hypothetical protein [Selenomonadales bacterium 4137-cl]